LLRKILKLNIYCLCIIINNGFIISKKNASIKMMFFEGWHAPLAGALLSRVAVVVTHGGYQRRAATGLVPIERNRLAVYRPVAIAFNNDTRPMPRHRARAFVADRGQRLAHEVGLALCRNHGTAVAGGVA
jgi:hypothetical protein